MPKHLFDCSAVTIWRSVAGSMRQTQLYFSAQICKVSWSMVNQISSCLIINKLTHYHNCFVMFILIKVVITLLLDQIIMQPNSTKNNQETCLNATSNKNNLWKKTLKTLNPIKRQNCTNRQMLPAKDNMHLIFFIKIFNTNAHAQRKGICWTITNTFIKLLCIANYY